MIQEFGRKLPAGKPWVLGHSKLAHFILFRIEQGRLCRWVFHFASCVSLFNLPPPFLVPDEIDSCHYYIYSVCSPEDRPGETVMKTLVWRRVSWLGREEWYWVDWMLCFADSWSSSSPFGLSECHHRPPSLSGQGSEGHICFSLFPSV